MNKHLEFELGNYKATMDIERGDGKITFTCTKTQVVKDEADQHVTITETMVDTHWLPESEMDEYEAHHVESFDEGVAKARADKAWEDLLKGATEQAKSQKRYYKIPRPTGNEFLN